MHCVPRYTRAAMTDPPSAPPSILSKVVHPLLFAVYPVAFLLAQNIDEMAVGDSARAFAAAAVYGVLVWALVHVMVRDADKSGAIAALLIAATYLYSEYSGTYWQIGLVVTGIATVSVLIVRSAADWRRYTAYLNAVAVVLLVLPAVQIVPYAVERAASSGHDVTGLVPEGEPRATPADGKTPDIYFVILDGYGRHDVLERFYGFDNAQFIEFLRNQGFYVAERARSNYARTAHSVVSTLYLNYLTDFIEQNELTDSRDLTRLTGLIQGSPVHRLLKRQGYTTHAFSSTGIEYPADHVHVPPAMFSYFEHEVAQRTPFAALLDRIYAANAHRMHYDAVRGAVARLNGVVDEPSPKFVMAHLVCPHPPFVFRADGSFYDVDPTDHRMTDGDAAVGESLSAEEYRQAYVEQVRWLNSEMAQWIERVRRADPEAVIVLQGDHGPGSMLKWNELENTNMLERFSILNALLLPGGGHGRLYPELSNVNTFRIIFNRYFNANLPLLPDAHYFSETDTPFLLHEIHFPDAPAAPRGPDRE